MKIIMSQKDIRHLYLPSTSHSHSAKRVSSTSIAESKIGVVCLSTAWSHERALKKALACLAFYKVMIFPFSGDRLLLWSLMYFDTCVCLYAASSSLILLSRASIEMFLIIIMHICLDDFANHYCSLISKFLLPLNIFFLGIHGLLDEIISTYPYIFLEACSSSIKRNLALGLTLVCLWFKASTWSCGKEECWNFN